MAANQAQELKSGNNRDFQFTDRDFIYIKELVKESTGIVLSDIKRDMVYGRLSRRLRQLGLSRFADYCEILKTGDSEELVSFTNAITTNLTSFFRENHHFEQLRDILREIQAEHKPNRRVRIWSAGCSTGEEPYSIAMTVKEVLGERPNMDIKILATDLDTNVVDHGSRGIYEAERIAGIPQAKAKKWFRKGTGSNEGYVSVSPFLKELITFKQLNLMHSWPMKGPFDIIFCRNVVIYFDKPTQKNLFDRFADVLADNGHLFLGHSESMFRVTTRFNLIGKTMYMKNRNAS